MPTTEPIRVSRDMKEMLKKLKTHPRETYDDVVRRLVETYKKCAPGGL
jgi:predicted CopG family antitoxin